MDPEATFNQEIEWLSIQNSKMEKIYAEGMKLLNEKVNPMIAGAKLIELVALSSEYDKFMTSMKILKTMKSLSEDTIF